MSGTRTIKVRGQLAGWSCFDSTAHGYLARTHNRSAYGVLLLLDSSGGGPEARTRPYRTQNMQRADCLGGSAPTIPPGDERWSPRILPIRSRRQHGAD